MDKWTEIACPGRFTEIQDKLTQLGGLIPPGCGSLSGKPVFTLNWAPDVLIFRHGKMRKRFVMRQKRVVRHYAVTQAMASRLAERAAMNTERVRNALLRADLAEGYGFVPGFTEFIKENFNEGLDYRVYDPETSPEKLIVFPAFPRYFRDTDYLLQIGHPYYVVLRWMPSGEQKRRGMNLPTMIDDRGQWDGLRYDVGYYPETGEERYLDLLGPYPEFGAYEHVFLTLENETGGDGVVMPNYENVILPLKDYLQKRDQVRALYANNAEYRRGRDLDNAMAEYEEDELAWSIQMDEIIKDARPAFHDTHVTVAGTSPPAPTGLIEVVKN